jgi:hypothetical protein
VLLRVNTPCIDWAGPTNGNGYGLMGVMARDGSKLWAHRIAYESVNGPIPDGLEIDHLCRRPVCVNPEHLEAVTHAENIRRAFRSHACKAGHPWTEATIYVRSNGTKTCRVCAAARARRYWHDRAVDAPELSLLA